MLLSIPVPQQLILLKLLWKPFWNKVWVNGMSETGGVVVHTTVNVTMKLYCLPFTDYVAVYIISFYLFYC